MKCESSSGHDKTGRHAASSSLTLSMVALVLGAVMIKLAVSGFALVLGLMVLSMGLAATMVLLIRSARDTGDQRTEAASPHPAVKGQRAENTTQNSELKTQDSKAGEAAPQLCALSQLIVSFESWWKSTADTEYLWPAFDRWLRDSLHEIAGARRLRGFHVDPTDHRLFSLTDDLEEPVWLGGEWRTVVEHVIQSGRMFLRGSTNGGDLVQRLCPPEQTSSSGASLPGPRWLLPIRENGQTRGLIVAGELESEDWRSSELLAAAGQVIQLLWREVRQETQLRLALQTDRTSGVLNRADLTLQAEKLLRDATDDEEPVVLLALAIEGNRRLDDERHWEVQNWLMHEIGQVLRRRLRTDDIVGRFSDDRFVAVLRRIDVSLGELIARKVLTSVAELIQQGDAALSSVHVRCGLAADPRCGFEDLLGRACDALQQARVSQVDLSCHEPVRHAGTEAGTGG